MRYLLELAQKDISAIKVTETCKHLSDKNKNKNRLRALQIFTIWTKFTVFRFGHSVFGLLTYLVRDTYSSDVGNSPSQ